MTFTHRLRATAACTAVAALALAGCSGDTADDEFPNAPVELIVAWAAGGGTDIQARALVQSANEHLGQQINVVNLTGGSGAIGWGTVAHSDDPSGYQLAIVSPEIAFGHEIGIYDFTLDDFTLITQFNQDYAALAVRADSEFEALDDFIAAATAEPGSVTVGTGGPGNMWDLAATGIEEVTGSTLTHVAFDGAATSAQALLGGTIDAMSFSLGEVSAQVEAGEMRVLAVAAPERDEGLSDTPTFTELGYAFEIGTFRGIAGPAGMDEDVVATLNDAFLAMAEDPDFVEVMNNNRFGIDVRSTAEFNENFQSASETYGRLLELSQS